MKPQIHLIGIPNTVLSREFDFSGFTMKARQIPATLAPYRYPIIEYGNEGSDIEVDEKVTILSRKELDALSTAKDAVGRKDGDNNPEFVSRVVVQLGKRVKKGDIIIHTLGDYAKDAVKLFPQCIHVEWGVGYMAPGFGAYRIFESYAWMHYHHGQDKNVQGSDYDFVVPPSCIPKEWPVGKGGAGIIYFGRIHESKGIAVVRALAEAMKKTIRVHGAGDPKPWQSKYLHFAGHAPSAARTVILGNADAILTPTRYIEPGARVSIEAQMCGTPVIGPDFGCYTEYIQEGRTGFRCRTLADYIEACRDVLHLNRTTIRKDAIARYSIEEAGRSYHRILTQLSDLWEEGWYTRRKTA